MFTIIRYFSLFLCFVIVINYFEENTARVELKDVSGGLTKDFITQVIIEPQTLPEILLEKHPTNNTIAAMY